MAEKFLFVHGWATDSSVWEGQTSGQIEDFCVSKIDLPGHGGIFRWDEPELRPSVKEIVYHIERDGGPFVGIGWSLGAMALIKTAAEAKRLFSALVLVGATPSFVERKNFKCARPASLVRRMIMDMKKDPAGTVDRFYALNFTEEEMGLEEAGKFLKRFRYPGPVRCETGDRGTQACRPIFRYDEITTALEALYRTDLRDVLGSIDVPVLVIHGSSDSITPPEAGEYLKENIKGARLELMEGAGHAPFLTRPGAFNRLISEFAERL